MNNKKVLIVGLGLIGGSYAKGLKQKGYYVASITKNFEDISYALKNRIIDEGRTTVDKDFIYKFDRIIFCLYPNVFYKWIEKYHYYFKQGTIINDVTGVKGYIVSKIQNILTNDVEFIPSHPMAGREVYGVRNSNNLIFKNANFIITPTEKNTQKGIDFAYQIAKDLEFKNITCLSVEEHDQMIGYVSQLTHCIAISLMTCNDSKDIKKYTGDSFKDLTRIANINEEMWSELFLENKEALLLEMELFNKEFIRLKNYIENDNIEELKEMMRLSTKRRNYFDE